MIKQRYSILTMALALSLGITTITAQAADLVLVDNGTAQAVVVTANEPSPVAEMAAGELVATVKKSTGAELAVVAESNAPSTGVRIYVGDTQAARTAGLNPDVFGIEPDGSTNETYRIKAVDGNLYILGKEDGQELYAQGFEAIDKGNPAILRDTRRGTLYGVVRVLEDSLGVRWLWPGELGRYVPPRDTLSLASDLDVSGKPAFKRRMYWIYKASEYYRYMLGYRDRYKKIWQGDKYHIMDRYGLGFSLDGAIRYYDAECRYLLLHEEGDTEPQPVVGHIFQGWWGKYGKEHPDWFTMNDAGARGPGADKNTYQVRMCVSNPELQRFIVEHDWDGGDTLSLGEADHRAFCRCPKCMEWDQPQPEGYKGYSTANRYVRFAQAVHELAVKRNPNVKIGMFLYMEYTHAPTITPTPDLSWMYGSFVPWGSGNECYYPMSDAAAKRNMDDWLGWGNTGMEMTYRPNYLLSGYTLPALDLEQTGEMIKLAAKHGMVGFSYDSLLGQWATKGPMLYMHMRLGTHPDLSIAEIEKEYYSAFGPAAADVEKYFDYWINYTRKDALAHKTWFYAKEAADRYPPEVFVPAEKILTEAMAKAKTSKNPEFAQRVAFIQDGLKHGELCTEFIRLYQANEFEKARKALLDLIAFRRAHEADLFMNYTSAALTETQEFNDLEDLLQGKYPEKKPVRPQVEIGIGWLTPWKTWYFLKDPKEEGIPKTQFMPETFDPKGWIEAEVGANLEETAVGPYNGTGWYATTFDIPKDWVERDVEILLEGIDKQAWVYVNDKLEEEITTEAQQMTVYEIWSTPWIVKVPAADIKCGEKNLLVVRIHSGFGAMGLYKPVKLRPVDASSEV